MAGLALPLSRFLRVILFLLFVSSFPSISAWGQNAQIAGTVIDSSKASLPSATIEFVNVETRVKWDTRSNDDGRYLAPLPAGIYQVTVKSTDFETEVIQNVRLNIAAKLSLDFVLHPGAISQSVTVDGSGISINTTDASVSTVIDRQFVENLPLNGRSFQSLMTYWWFRRRALARAVNSVSTANARKPTTSQSME
jgi:Carboxypeptidase regulatory-like domain